MGSRGALPLSGLVSRGGPKNPAPGSAVQIIKDAETTWLAPGTTQARFSARKAPRLPLRWVDEPVRTL